MHSVQTTKQQARPSRAWTRRRSEGRGERTPVRDPSNEGLQQRPGGRERPSKTEAPGAPRAPDDFLLLVAISGVLPLIQAIYKGPRGAAFLPVPNHTREGY